MPLKIVKRPGSPVWYVRGSVAGESVFETTKTEDRKLAEQYKAKRESALYEQRQLGRRGAVPFVSAATAYLEFEPRGETTQAAVIRLVDHFGMTPVAAIGQGEADAAVAKLLRPDAKPATKIRLIYTPLTSVLAFAHRRGWRDAPTLEKPALPRGKTRWIAPAEAAALIDGAAAHLKPLLIFVLCTGARLAEVIELDWQDVDLAGAKAIFRDTKNGFDRIAALPPAAIVALANLKHRQGAVFRTERGRPYADRGRVEGGQIKTAFHTACRRAGLSNLTPHDLRHSWASWFYAITKDLLLLKAEGGWRTLTMVERYAHLLPPHMALEVKTIWGATHPRIGKLPAPRANPVQRNRNKSITN